MALEREIKLRFASAAEARARVIELGATPFRGRRLQEDCLLDDEQQSLKARASTIRVRTECGQGVLTFKGPPHPGPMKLREELETVVGDSEMLRTILERLGFRVWFRYEKYREEFHLDDVIIAIDETPVGVFIELEGSEAHIHDVAQKLGREPADYLTDSYYRLFLEHRAAHGLTDAHMVFPSRI
jgi:adenylate cyclase class 2